MLNITAKFFNLNNIIVNKEKLVLLVNNPKKNNNKEFYKKKKEISFGNFVIKIKLLYFKKSVRFFRVWISIKKNKKFIIN